MANYAEQFRAVWDSDNGTSWRVLFQLKDGTRLVRPRIRALGKAPVLKREQSDNVWGTSLELFLQCDNEGEFADFYTTDPFAWKIILEIYDASDSEWKTWWTGFMVPELFSAPVIGVPYDVQVTATDGLGELKRHDFAVSDVTTAYSVCSYRTCIDYLLNLTGLEYDATVEDECPIMCSSLALSGTSTDFLDAEFDLSFMDGETCYDALQGLLRSMNAVVFRRANAWWIVRETDLATAQGGSVPDVHRYFSGWKTWMGNSLSRTSMEDYYGGDRLGNISNAANSIRYFWPVGYMTQEMEPAARKVVVTNDYQVSAANVVKDPKFRAGTTSWTKTSGVQIQTAGVLPGWAKIPGGSTSQYVSQNVSVEQAITGSFTLNVKAKAAQIAQTGTSTTYPVNVYIIDTGTGKVLGQNSSGEYVWDVYGTSGFSDGVYLHLSSADKVELLSIDFEDLPANFSIRVNGGTANRANLVLYEVYIETEAEAKGMRAEVIISNSARNDDAETEIPLNSGSLNGWILHQELLIDPDTDSVVTGVASSKITASKLIELVALDRTLQVAEPRTWLRGTLRLLPSSALVTNTEPLGFRCCLDGTNMTEFFLQTYSWDLVSDEMEVEMLSLPDSTIEISSYSVTTEETE